LHLLFKTKLRGIKVPPETPPSQGTYGSPETPPLKENKLMLTE